VTAFLAIVRAATAPTEAASAALFGRAAIPFFCARLARVGGSSGSGRTLDLLRVSPRN
jgi:hypothetical protein